MPNKSAIFSGVKKCLKPIAKDTRWVVVLCLPVLLLAGCVTKSTVETREKANPAAYAALSPEIKTLVDQGRVAVGMNADAVVLAWGSPAEILQSGNKNGEFATWVYRGSFLEETRYWAGNRHPYLTHDYQPRTYVRAEIVFANGFVQSWQMRPQPEN